MKRRPFIAGGLVVFLLLLFYGPFESFRLLWINTAMYSSHFKWLAKSLYSGRYITSVLEQNSILTIEKTDTSAIDIVSNDGLYFAEVKGSYYKGFIIKIENPSRLNLVSSNNNQGKLLEDLVQENRASGGINASAYSDDTMKGIVWGTTIINGIITNSGRNDAVHTIGGMNGEYKLVVGRFTNAEIAGQKYVWAFEFGPILISNGEKTTLSAYSGGIAPRTAIGQLKNGAVLLVVIDGRRIDSYGATFQDIQEIMFANGAVNAICLDGGSSSTIMYDGKIQNEPSGGTNERLLPNAIIFK
ncbi:exopolysaccharide biosynthesis protein [Spirochaetia bacterium]|nr:exopolysaccharide biosynthesis protein [Spirochaetia bacterium]